MKVGLWKVGGSKDEENRLTLIAPASLSDATNIREVILEFYKDHHWWSKTVIPPFVAYGNISYSSNYFLVSFRKLRRVELSVPQPWFTPANWWRTTVLQDHEGLRYREGIDLLNVRLGVLGKMSTVPALQNQGHYHIRFCIDVNQKKLRHIFLYNRYIRYINYYIDLFIFIILLLFLLSLNTIITYLSFIYF